MARMQSLDCWVTVFAMQAVSQFESFENGEVKFLAVPKKCDL